MLLKHIEAPASSNNCNYCNNPNTAHLDSPSKSQFPPLQKNPALICMLNPPRINLCPPPSTNPLSSTKEKLPPAANPPSQHKSSFLFPAQILPDFQDLVQFHGTSGFSSNLGMVPLNLGQLGGMLILPHPC